MKSVLRSQISLQDMCQVCMKIIGLFSVTWRGVRSNSSVKIIYSVIKLVGMLLLSTGFNYRALTKTKDVLWLFQTEINRENTSRGSMNKTWYVSTARKNLQKRAISRSICSYLTILAGLFARTIVERNFSLKNFSTCMSREYQKTISKRSTGFISSRSFLSDRVSNPWNP